MSVEKACEVCSVVRGTVSGRHGIDRTIQLALAMKAAGFLVRKGLRRNSGGSSESSKQLWIGAAFPDLCY